MGSVESMDNMLMSIESKVMRAAHASFSSWPLWEACHQSCLFCQYSFGPEKNYAVVYPSTHELSYWLRAQI